LQKFKRRVRKPLKIQITLTEFSN